MPYGIDHKFPVLGMVCEIGAVIEAAACVGDAIEPGLLIPLMPTLDLYCLMELIVCQPMGLAGRLLFLTCQRHSSKH